MPKYKLFANRRAFRANGILSQDCFVLAVQLVHNAGHRERLKTLPR